MDSLSKKALPLAVLGISFFLYVLYGLLLFHLEPWVKKSITGAFHVDDWFYLASTLLFDRLLYGLVYVLGGWFFFIDFYPFLTRFPLAWVKKAPKAL